MIETIEMIHRLRKLREDHYLTQKEVGKYLWINQQTYSLYETGKREIPIDMLVRLAEFYGVSLDYILELTEDPTPYPKPKK